MFLKQIESRLVNKIVCYKKDNRNPGQKNLLHIGNWIAKVRYITDAAGISQSCIYKFLERMKEKY